MIERNDVVAVKRVAGVTTVYMLGGHELVFEMEVGERVWTYFDGNQPEADDVPTAHFR
ncbi:MAG TPA: hypothetical protein VGQ55_03530 [Pyrinomonadaceae bacterium]|nr:hypothetical protein [Pyrinomonadaceae bacterium]